MKTAEEALTELIERFELHLDAAVTIYGKEHADTPPALQAFKHAIRMTHQLLDEIGDRNAERD